MKCVSVSPEAQHMEKSN